MTDLRPLETQLYDPVRSRRRALVVMLVLLVLHIWAVWGHTSSIWSDHGRWLYDIERYAAGQLPYRDFDWSQPPLAMWVLGSLARVAGTDLTAVTAIMSAVAVLLFVTYLLVCSRIATGSALPATLTGLVFATAYANRFGPPLPLGTASPSGPFGVLFLLTAIAVAVRLFDQPHPRSAALVGVTVGLTVLTRYDLWLAAVAVAVWSAWAVRRTSGRQVARIALLLGIGLTLVLGTVVALMQSGPDAFAGLLPRDLSDAVRNVLPSWERLTIELAATAALGIAGVVALWLCLALDDTRAWVMGGILLLVFLSACAVHAGMTTAMAREIVAGGSHPPTGMLAESVRSLVASGASPIRTALYLLDQRFQQHLFPSLLPGILLVVLFRRWHAWPQTRGRDLTLLLLAVSGALRVKRGFAGPDWYNVMVEVPAYAVFLHLVAASAGREARRSVSVALAIMLVVACYTYYNLGRGPLTMRPYPAFTTPRGVVRWGLMESSTFATIAAELDRLDPQRMRPLLAFGPSGGWNYYFARRNPTRYTRGFQTDAGADSAGAAMDTLRVGTIVVDTRRGLRVMPPPRLDLRVWAVPATDSVVRFDRPAFDALLAGCRGTPVHADPADLVIYDCPVRRTVTPPGRPR
jgi:hypothetical protein